MDKSKIKDLILILLVLVNAFLLYIVLTDDMEDRQTREYSAEALKDILSENGITLGPEVEIPDSVPFQYSLKRDLDSEEDMISSLIGKCTVEDQGGNIYVYAGKNGTATFRGTGEFEMLLDPGLDANGDPVSTAKKALKRLGIEIGDAEPKITNNGGDTTVTLCCSWKGTTIYNAEVSFLFHADYLMIISGKRPLDEKISSQSSEDYPDSVTILMNFLQSMNDTGLVCNEIDDLSVQYYMYSAVSGSCTLKPVWCITTNVGCFYFDAETGKSEDLGGVS